MKNNISIKKISVLFCLITLSTQAQLKVNTAGYVGIGTISPNYGLHYIGSWAMFQGSSGSTSSSPMIQGNNAYSGASTPNPDYTWYNDLGTGMAHPTGGRIALFSSGYEHLRVDHGGSYQVSCWGNLYAQFSWTSSDRRYKRNISTLESPLEKVMKLRGVSYEYNREEFPEMHFNEGKAMGLIAQELQEIVPEAVRADEKGYLAVNYNAVIPFLIEAIKEQQKQIQELKQQSAGSNSKSSSLGNASTTSKDDANALDKPVLYQNAPNPFNNVTSIKYYIPSTARTANIYVYDITGNKKKSFDINEKGDGQIEIAANELGKGIYFYSMVIDGKIQDSKTMLITE